MNYYEHHIGDYDSATAHLSLVEDGVYGRLLRVYYRTEQAIPADIKQACRLVRAQSKAERDAVADVLREFFELRDDGWHQHRADEEIARYHETIPDREARRENDRERQRRARDRRKSLFDALRCHNIVPPYDTKTSELESMLSRATSQPKARDVTQPVTRDNTATQTPLPNTQEYRDTSSQGHASRAHAHESPPEASGQQPTPAGLACRAMKAAGIAAVNPGDPRLLALLQQGATIDEFAGLATEAAEKGKGFAWVLVTLAARRTEAAGISLAPRPQDAWDHDRASMCRRAIELGLEDWPTFERRHIDAGKTPSFAAWERDLRAANENAKVAA